jgi:NTP pyrophosphatase (non-canonical NTP hydrolase)
MQIIESQIDQINKIRLQMWPESAKLNIDEFDHLLATLVEEAGELRQAIRSFLGRPYSPEKVAFRTHLVEELGDILVPVVALSNQLKIPISEALEFAIEKLTNRLKKKQENPEPIMKFDAMKHQPLKYDLEDPINVCSS